ncbi:hypothetical protein FRC04_005219 [Tulasnella sp. 424]|nr:hypothetical protein FRC04_005219 [Tulasnella sp. 424]KAG8963344.1 hypothetical protein FRC05_004781 [Tulasnella sp. 425]
MAYGRLSNRTRVVVKYFALYRDIRPEDPTDLTPGEEEEFEVTWKMQQKALREVFQEFLDASEKLRHPHIVPTLGYRVDALKPYLLQPRYIPMDQWLQYHNTELNERLIWLREAAEGLRYLHEARLDAIPWHGQVHLNNILLRTLPNSRLVAAISDCYHLRAAWHAHRVIREASGSLYDYGYPTGLGGDHLYVTPELLRDGTWNGSQSEDVCTFGLSILHAITRDWPVSIRQTFTFDIDKRMIWRTPNPFDYPDSLPAEDPLWNLLYSMFRTADQRPTMAQVVEGLDRRIMWDPQAPQTDAGNTEELPETTLDTGTQAHIRSLLAAEVSDLELGIKMSDDLPLISETQFAKVRVVRLKEPDGRISDVAVKEIKVQLINSSVKDTERAVKRMLREARAWQALKHVYVLPLLGFKVYGTNPCLISPWCPEGDLASYMERKVELGYEDRIKIAVQVGLGLRFIHEQPIMHGDIKPQNVLLYQGQPAICDFGTARWIEEAAADTTTGMIAARTTRYASPERLAESRSKTTKSDVWSFGGLALFLRDVADSQGIAWPPEE